MGIVQDVRVIAKTDLLEEKVGKALAQAQAATDLAKEALVGERGVAIDTGQGTTVVSSSGSNNNTVNPTSAADQSLSNAQLNGMFSGINSLVANTSGGNGVVNTSAGTTPTPDTLASSVIQQAISKGLLNLSGTNLASGVSTVGGGVTNAVGGTNAVLNAQGAPSDTTLSALQTAMTAQNIPLTTQQSIISGYVSNAYGEPGVVTASNLVNNAVNTPGLSVMTPSLIYNQGSVGSVLKAVVGFDALGNLAKTTGKPLVHQVRLDGNFPTPTSLDASLAGQSAWTAYNIPPPVTSWTLGYYYATMNFAGTVSYYFGGLSQAIQQAQQVAISAYAATYYIGGFLGWLGSTPGSPPGTPGYAKFLATPIAGGAATYVVRVITNGACSGAPGTAAVCALTQQPYESAYPLTGTFTTSLVNGVFTVSPYDSEAPLLYTTPQSKLRLAVGDGVNVIDNRFIDILPAVGGGVLTQVVKSDGTTVNNTNYYSDQGVLTQVGIPLSSVPYYMLK